MGAVLLVRAQDNPVIDSPDKWLAGEIPVTIADNIPYGFKQMPINWVGERTVAEINGVDLSTLPLFPGVRVTDSGTITNGDNQLTVNAQDVLVFQKQTGPQGSFYNYGPKTSLSTGDYYMIRVTDKTLEEVELYLEGYNKKLTYTSDQYNPGTDNRRFTTTNVRVSASGNNSFTEQGILDAVATWNTSHPDNTLIINDTDNLTYFQCDGIMPEELFDEWKENTQQLALADYYKRRRWYITKDGLNALAANDGLIQGEAAEVNQYLRDGLLD